MQHSIFTKITLGILLFTCGACSVQNNLYLNNPTPLEKGEQEFCLGISTGIQPKVGSLGLQDEVIYNNEFKLAPSLHIGARFRLADRLTLGTQLHLPYIIGGFGLDIRPQYSFFEKGSKFNIAIAGQAGFVVSKDSIFKNNVEPLGIPNTVTGLINVDITLPIAYKVSKELTLILTPRLSAFSFRLRENAFEKEPVTKYNFNSKVLTLGLRGKKWHIEASALQLENKIIPSIGAALIFMN